MFHGASIDKIVHHMCDTFKLTAGLLELYIGLHSRNMEHHTLVGPNQVHYKKIYKFGFRDCILLSVPADPHSQLDFLSAIDERANPAFPYVEISGSHGTRLDVTYATCHASKFTN